MDKFAQKTDEERQDIFNEVASRRDVIPIVIEKDFWVCWTLKRLFTNPQISPYITFKGGTSLSKVYGLIERFSEDIDLTVSPQAPFLKDGKDVLEPDLSRNARERRLKTRRENAQKFVQNFAFPRIKENIEKALEREDGWQLLMAPDDPDYQTIIFEYPKTVTEVSYISPTIKLEFGGRGGTEPQEEKIIQPYTAEYFTALFENPFCTLTTLSVLRSFWEKVTILHALHHGAKMRSRMSRHLYDTFMMHRNGLTDKAKTEKSLLAHVVENKMLFFRDPKASYETAHMGSLRLVPTQEQSEELKQDYKAMEEMFMGTPPDFQEIIATLSEMEKILNES